MILRAATIALLILYPIAWSAPLMRAGLLPLFGLSEISVLTGLAALWETDLFLALVVALFALVAPTVKTGLLLAVQWGRIGPRVFPFLHFLGRLAMADIFLIAIYVTVIKGIGVGRVEIAWGLYLFTGCILASMLLGHLSERKSAD